MPETQGNKVTAKKTEIQGYISIWGDGVIAIRPADGESYERALTFIRSNRRGNHTLLANITLEPWPA